MCSDDLPALVAMMATGRCALAGPRRCAMPLLNAHDARSTRLKRVCGMADLGRFSIVPDRSSQGFLNQLVAMKVREAPRRPRDAHA